jgi:diguanylate cyclase (GGDEF)-like protein
VAEVAYHTRTRAASSRAAGATWAARLRGMARRAGRKRSAAALVAGALVACGLLAAVVGAREVARSDSGKAQLGFSLASAEIASTLKLAIEQEEGLVIDASAYVAGNPRTTPAEFAQWAATVRALERHPELQAFGLLVLVPASQLNAFKRRMLAHSILPQNRQPAGSRGAFEVVPAGKRAAYCFAAAGVVRQLVTTLPPGLDYCAVEPTLLQARDTAQSGYTPFMEGSTPTLGIQTPVYRGGQTPPTVGERRAAFLGWLGESLVPNRVLRSALQGHPHVAVKFRYHAAGSDVTFSSGVAAAGARRATFDLHNGWTMQSFASLPGSGVFADRNALTLLVGGTILSLLVGLLVFVLATGRTRALSLVREKTRELSYQALHDSLTGLPNRALVIQRAEQMLARPAIGAALFIDVDCFKETNDRLGHAAGDQLLKAVAGRLASVVREQDIVGRLGGDEFVVLLESADGEAQPARVAERIIKTLRRPVSLDDGRIVSVSASVGISMGPRRTVDELLRDADLALYAAKAAGKDRYVLYEPAMAPDAAEQPELEIQAHELGVTRRESAT